MSEVPCGRQTPVVEREEMTRCTPRKEAKGGGGQGKQRRYQQLYLDLGQRDFAQRQICGMCGMMVVHGVEEDIKEHERICRDYTVGIAFHSETARAVASPNKDSTVYQVRHRGSYTLLLVDSSCGRSYHNFCFQIRPGDSQALWKKVAQVRAIVDQELGFVPDPEESNSSSTFLYTRKKRVIGLCTVLPIRRGYALSACNSERSTQARKAAIGVHQLWIHSKFRREGVATALLDAAREKMYFGLVVPAAQVAFSSPTLAGALFARRYVSMSSGSSDVLVYDVNRVAT
jgi:GNAT superfamily N-acetyltransferase